MRMLRPVWLVVFGAVSALGCSSDGGSGGSAGAGGFTCEPPNLRQNSACTMCVQSNCADEYQTICDNRCSAPGPTTPLSPQCQEAVDALGTCIDDHCPGCDQDDAESGGSGGTGAGGASAGGVGGASAGGSGSGQGCVIGGAVCNWYSASADPPSAVVAACNMSGGTPVDHCPSDALYGCCEQPTGSICYYNLDDVEMRISKACGTAGGIWTTTPP